MLDQVRALGPTLRELSPTIDRAAAVPPEIVDALLDLGVFRLATPAAAGGLEAPPERMVEIFEELGRADGATGWVAMIGAGTGIALAWLEPDVAKRMLADPRFLIAGVAAPMGRAEPVDGGWRLTGRWAFSSGCRHATWLVAGAMTPSGVRMCVLPAADVTIHDTWQVMGLRGTGSHDFSVHDVFVPAEHVFSLAGPPYASGALYRIPPFTTLSIGIAAVALGIARGAIEDFTALAATKPGRPAFRNAVAEATALHRSGLAYLQSELVQGGAGKVRRAAQRLAIATGTRHAARAVDLLYSAAGGTAVYDAGPLQQRFRDVHAATQHAMVSADIVETAGAVLLGEKVDSTRL
ncbi:acyl-CoA dehydrogenase family protein [Catenuloplanes japonicus]|uniref:acyl-CoA dehydrogenase family protein n=1 Tax=Catenuloplanes japonicus TaxID=33876 RepID=UPI0007C527D5|nr:acyl-CoA dehydrogenase family protein [Catenuloplanes japonicus]